MRRGTEMVAGLPGTGIGGVFFLLSALLMPLVELVRTLQGRSNIRRWRVVLEHSGMALAILGAMWAMGWLIGQLLFALLRTHFSSTASAALNPKNFIQAPPILFTLGTLLMVLLSVGILRRLFGRTAVPDPENVKRPVCS